VFALSRYLLGLPRPLRHFNSLVQNKISIEYSEMMQPDIRLHPNAHAPGLANVRRYVRNKGEVAGSLDGGAKHALMPGAGPGLAPGLDLSSVRNERPQLHRILVIYDDRLVLAESAYLSPGYVLGLVPSLAPDRRSGRGRWCSSSLHYFELPPIYLRLILKRDIIRLDRAAGVFDLLVR
jgi:hypothetical protein